MSRKLKRWWRSPVQRRRRILVAGIVALVALTQLPRLMKQSDSPPLRAGPSGLNIAWLPAEVQRWREPINRYAGKYNIDADLIAIIITLESRGDPTAESPIGAQGLMQVMPLTAQDIARKFLVKPVATYDIYDPPTNIEFGTAYLSYLRREFGESAQGPSWDRTVELIAAGYNGGPGTANDLEKGTARSKENTDYAVNALRLWQARAAATMPTLQR